MKAKYGLILILIVLLALKSGCSTRGKLPYGAWQSDNPYIILHVIHDVYNNPDNPVGLYCGQYEKDGQIIDIFFRFNSGYKGMAIYDPSDFREGRLYGDNPYFSGTYNYAKDKLVYKLKPHWKEEHGIKEIIFTKIQDYEP
jgi:hypothetical protein